MYRSLSVLGCLVGVAALVVASGCTPSGPATVLVSGKLTIGGQPANDVTITLTPIDSTLVTASGPVTNGTFKLYSGVEGKEGAMPGKYKVGLAAVSSAADASAMYSGTAGGGPPPTPTAPFPARYTSAGTSDKEVEVPKGGGELVIDIPAA